MSILFSDFLYIITTELFDVLLSGVLRKYQSKTKETEKYFISCYGKSFVSCSDNNILSLPISDNNNGNSIYLQFKLKYSIRNISPRYDFPNRKADFNIPDWTKVKDKSSLLLLLLLQ